MTDPTKVCPHEPTVAMLVAATQTFGNENFGATMIWQAMYDAAPAEAAQGEVERVIELLEANIAIGKDGQLVLTDEHVRTMREAAAMLRALAPKAVLPRFSADHPRDCSCERCSAEQPAYPWVPRAAYEALQAENERKRLLLEVRNAPAEAAPGVAYAYPAFPPAEAAQGEVALRDIAAERERQKSVEGWTPQHDDDHYNGELCLAASCYARHASGLYPASVPKIWPWDEDSWKPKKPRRDLIRAAALIVAEIERLDRALAPKAAQDCSLSAHAKG
jgi:hypothetical protein